MTVEHKFEVAGMDYIFAGEHMLCDTTRFMTRAVTVAEIGTDGILRFKVDATDENAIRFVRAIEDTLGRRLTGISVEKVTVSEGENQAK